ncbi:protein kinase [Scytonema sp. UIC 10036]|uniref:serine/threonine-protein kinase n=1 Tax=Scytonema sp. UIC 10036 TaxID=2304196 RepID=UPI0012DA0C2E|nr:serine/threonine-protein kinase [Scytonema sp. UIC 10036]MUG94194.1 protein kinase [Scytonema sp. UIC 10036]
MEQNQLVSVEQNLAELQNRLPQDIAVMDGLALALKKIENLLPENQKVKEDLTDLQNNLRNELSNIRKELDNNSEKILAEAQTILAQGLDEIESKLESGFDNLRSQQHQAETTIQNELVTLKTQLNDCQNEQQQLHSKVVLLQGQLKNVISEFKHLQGYNTQLEEKFNQLLREFAESKEFKETRFSPQNREKLEPQVQLTTRESTPQKETKCRHEGNLPGVLFCKHCGQPIDVLKQIRQYQVLQILAEEENRNTYIACEKTDDMSNPYRILALQEMSIDIAQINQCREICMQMGHTFKSLLYPGIPKFFDLFVEDKNKYLVMERLFGQNLEQHIYQQEGVPYQQVIKWMIEVCETLDYLHNQQPPIIHGDIQPLNLLVRKLDNRIVLQNFRAINQIGMSQGSFLHLGIYAAPEQKKGQSQIQSDIYAIGVTLIFLLTRENPEKFYDRGDRTNQFYLEGVRNIAPQLQTIILRATQYHPSDRYQTAKELAQALIKLSLV